MKRIMILGASVLQVPIIQRAKALGYKVIAVDMNSKAVGFQHADKALNISTIDTEAIYHYLSYRNHFIAVDNQQGTFSRNYNEDAYFDRVLSLYFVFWTIKGRKESFLFPYMRFVREGSTHQKKSLPE